MADDDYLIPGSELVDVRILESKAHSELCAVQSYCLNGGTCYRLPTLGVHYCECMENFEGKRCHMKKMSLDIDANKMNDATFNWELVKPLLIVGAGVLVCAMAIICVYFLISYCCKRCSERKGKYMLAQKSVSHDALVIEVEENSVDGDVTARRTRKASTRTRLAAVSSTPEQAKPFHVQQTTPAAATAASEALQKVLSLSNATELGQGCDFVDNSAQSPSVDEKQKTVDQPISFYGTSADGGTVTRNVASLTHETEGTSARRSSDCQSPNDSNNNEEMGTCNFSSVSKNPLGGQHKRPTDFGQQKIPPVSVSNDLDDALYDSDPEATAL